MSVKSKDPENVSSAMQIQGVFSTVADLSVKGSDDIALR